MATASAATPPSTLSTVNSLPRPPKTLPQPPAIKPVRPPSAAGQVSAAPQISPRPTTQELSAAPVFDEALIPVGNPTPEENKDLAEALTAYQHSGGTDLSGLEIFLQQHPNSAWKPALLLNMALAWRNEGRFSQAISAFDTVWTLISTQSGYRIQAMADRALGELLQIYDWTGNYEKIQPLLAAAKGRNITGGATVMMDEARSELQDAKNHTANFRCGPYALAKLLEYDHHTNVDIAKLLETKTDDKGISLAELDQLAATSGMKYQMAFREPGAVIPDQAIVHWKLDHFSALVKTQHGYYQVLDPQFNFFFRHGLSVKQDLFDSESDGYFLIPAGPLPQGWKPVTQQEAEMVWGRGPGPNPNPNDYTPQDKKNCPTNGPGMAFFNVDLMLVNLTIQDTPLFYNPPIGPNVDMHVTYNQKDTISVANPTYSHLGSKWTFDWFSFITDGGQGSPYPPGAPAGTPPNHYVRGGGWMTAPGTMVSSSGTGGGGEEPADQPACQDVTFPPDINGDVLQYICSSDSYVSTHPDGSQEIYARQGTVDSSGQRNVYLSAIKDPAGNTLTINYDTGSYPFRIDSVTDALGQSTTLNYNNSADPYQITSVSDWTGRTCHFQYNSDGELQQITDEIGMQSSFVYDDNELITNMVTPYGTSTFSYSEPNGDTSVRDLMATDPNGDRQDFIYIDGSSVPDSDPYVPDVPYVPTVPTSSSGLFNGYLEYRNTFEFDKKAMSEIGSDQPSNHLNLASIYHWLHETDSSGDTLDYTSGILETEKQPLENRVWYLYPGQQVGYNDFGITLQQPSIVARVVENPGAPTDPTQYASQVYQIGYNSFGNVTNYIDPLGRETALDYSNNGIDLLDARQTTGGSINDYLAQFGGYNSQHRPATYTNSSLQAYSFKWNQFGEVTNVIDPKNEIENIGYNSSGYMINFNELWSGGAKTTSLGYDSYGRINALTDSQGYTLSYNYDDLNRLVRITFPDTTFLQYDYSRLDLVHVWDRAGNVTQLTYDGLGRPLTLEDRLGHTTQFGWCGCGALQSITDPLSHTTTWERDLEGRITDKIYDDSSDYHYDYYSYTNPSTGLVYGSGNLEDDVDPKQQVKTYVYNIDNTLTNIAYSGTVYYGATGNPIVTSPVSFTYDPNYLRLATMTDGTGQTTFGYNPVPATPSTGANQLTSMAGPLANSTISYSYDGLGRLVSQSINGAVESVAYDALGRITNHTTLLGQFIPTYVSDSYNIASIAYPNSQTANYAYYGNSEDQCLSQILNKNSSGGTLSQFNYQYNVIRNISQWTQQTGPNSPQVENMQYDNECQLLNAESGPQGQSAAQGYTYTYDNAGNRTSEQIDNASAATSATTASSYNDLNQLTSRTASGPMPVRFQGTVNQPASVTVNGQPASVTPNPNGPSGSQQFTASVTLPPGNNAIQIAASGNGASAVTNYNLMVGGGTPKSFTYDANGNCANFTSGATNVTYEWDAENRLVAINNQYNNTRSEFTYDGYGRRVKIIEKANGTATSTNQFVWSGMSLCQQRDGSDNVTKRFYAEGEQISGANYYFTRDHLGSVREMTDSSGNIRAEYAYDPYGRQTKVSGDLNADFGYTGYYVHQPSGLQLALFRAYDSDIGRFINRDPIEEGGGLNLYDYVANNPINYFDPLGLEWMISIGFSGTIGTTLFNSLMGLPYGFYGTSDSIGFTSGGNIVFQHSDALMNGAGIFVGGGLDLSISHSNCPTKPGWNHSEGTHSEGDLGIDLGGGLDSDDSGWGVSKGLNLEAADGFDFFTSGPAQTTTYATTPIDFSGIPDDGTF